jgi:hypothetical protein
MQFSPRKSKSKKIAERRIVTVIHVNLTLSIFIILSGKVKTQLI